VSQGRGRARPAARAVHRRRGGHGRHGRVRPCRLAGGGAEVRLAGHHAGEAGQRVCLRSQAGAGCGDQRPGQGGGAGRVTVGEGGEGVHDRCGLGDGGDGGRAQVQLAGGGCQLVVGAPVPEREQGQFRVPDLGDAAEQQVPRAGYGAGRDRKPGGGSGQGQQLPRRAQQGVDRACPVLAQREAGAGAGEVEGMVHAPIVGDRFAFTSSMYAHED
jgi:hypothetical protein